jgi:VWFA-related protein
VTALKFFSASTPLAPAGILFAAILFAASGASAHAQTPAPQKPAPPAEQKPEQKPEPQPDQQPDSPIQTITARANLVNLVFTVTDKDGHFKKDLRRENFGLLDNGRPPAQVLGFAQQTNLPLRIGIMLDTSSSVRTRFKFEQDSALDFFLELLKPGDRAFVEGFDINIALTQDYTGNVDLLNQGIRKLRPGGGTALFDNLYKTCQNQMLTLQTTAAAPDVRKVIILVSDGDDNYSRALESDAIKMCQRAETVVYAISTDTSPTRGHGGDTLKTIAEATGGQVFYPVRLEDMAVFFKNIEEELRSQYSLEYRPSDFKLDGAFRTIYLQSTDRRYHVRARTGYFAPKVGQ